MRSTETKPPVSEVSGSVLDGAATVDLVSMLPRGLPQKTKRAAIAVINANRHLEQTHIGMVVRYVQTVELRDRLFRAAEEEPTRQAMSSLKDVETVLGNLERGLCITGSSRKWNLTAGKRGPRASITEAIDEQGPAENKRGRLKLA